MLALGMSILSVLKVCSVYVSIILITDGSLQDSFPIGTKKEKNEVKGREGKFLNTFKLQQQNQAVSNDFSWKDVPYELS